jgi:glycosyltransferase involved in cell wall biosynthesis
MDSLLEQTCPNLEILVVNDGSKGNIRERIQKYTAPDSKSGSGPTVRFIDLPENVGLLRARVLGAREASGEYIAFVDSDAYLKWDMIRQLAAGIGDADLCCCGTIRETQDGAVLSVTKTETILTLPGMAVLRQHYSGQNGKLGITDVSVWGKLYRRNLFAQLRFQNGLLFEDIHLMPYLLQCAQVRFIPYAGYHYLVTPDSLINSKDPDHLKRGYENCFEIWDDHEQLYHSMGEDELLMELQCVRIEKIITHMLCGNVPHSCEEWSEKILYRTVLRVMSSPIGAKRRMRYVAFCLLGKRGYRFLKRILQ